jgi:hypothetical protein
VAYPDRIPGQFGRLLIAMLDEHVVLAVGHG